MDDAAQAAAYAQADFSESNTLFIEQFRQQFPTVQPHQVLDLGCGPGDICCRFAETYPGTHVTGVDAAEAMLELAREAASTCSARDRVRFDRGMIQAYDHGEFDVVLSNSLLHHLADPDSLWHAIKRLAEPGAAVLVMDLVRPDSQEAAQNLVDCYSGQEPEVLRRDFFNSLCAAFTIDEVEAQLERAGFGSFSVTMVSDRHMLIRGQI